ncbi:MAG TPA: hypothetical protein VLJ62_30355, partial [Burkholderiaceae bacterium]|nr:hypothetical protein [Burkholderiaceae bacterium]
MSATRKPPSTAKTRTGAPAGASNTSPLTEQDIYLFREGTHAALGDKFGCQLTERGAHFAVWAPNAAAVAVIGDFNEWNGAAHPLRPRSDSSGIWERFVDGVTQGACYKYRISARDGAQLDKADPFAFFAELPPLTASRAWRLDHEWHDADW